MSANDWKIEASIDDYYQYPEKYSSITKSSTRSATDQKRLAALFDRYKDPQEEDKISEDGIVRFCDDLQLDPVGQPVLLIAWKFKAQTQCVFTKKEFMTGMTELGSVYSHASSYYICNTITISVALDFVLIHCHP